jgi:pimeloyl-ACP methyl ester carboxylesterase
MYYEIHGDGESFAMICGGGGSTKDHAKAIPFFSPEYKLILFDNRGTGQSDAPDVPYTFEMLADDLAGLLDALDIDSAHIFGESFGGALAQAFTLRHPRRLRSLILASTSCGGKHMVISPERLKLLSSVTNMTPEESAKVRIQMFITPEFTAKNPAVINEMMKHMMENPTPSWGLMRQQEASQAAMTTGYYERLPEIKVPTLIIAGESDITVVAENSKILASRIPGSELVIFKNAGHLLIEVWEEFNRTMLDFLRRHSTKKA